MKNKQKEIGNHEKNKKIYKKRKNYPQKIGTKRIQLRQEETPGQNKNGKEREVWKKE